MEKIRDNTELESAILKTISWFDLFDYPLTSREIHQYLWKNESKFHEVEKALVESDSLKRKLSSKEAFYFLNGRDTVKTRKSRYVYAERKFKKALRICRIFTMLPWIKMIAICNTLGISNARDESDIDLFIIVSQNRIWATRFCVVGFLRVFGLRPLLNRFGSKREYRKDKIDASFYATENELNLQSVAINDGEDIYLAYWIHSLVPIYDVDKTYKRFMEFNSWTRSFIPNSINHIPSYRRRLSCPSKFTHSVISLITGNMFEKFAKWTELKIMPEKLKKMGEENTSSVVISETMLKFHDQDRREYYKRQWLKKISDITKN